MGSATNDLDTLFQIVSMLRVQIVSMLHEKRTSANDCGRRAMSADVQNAEERLIFCANSTLLKYKPSSSDVDCSNKLLEQKYGTRFICGCCVIVGPRNMQLVYETWFPPLQTVLKILLKISCVVEPRGFEDMALQSVQSCTRILQEGAAMIRHPAPRGSGSRQALVDF
jgi:conserved oligomeric Golgi complex subunit 3